MTPPEAMAAVESRAFALRLPMGDICRIARVSHSTWCRAKNRGSIRVRTLRKVEDTLDYLERQAAEAQPQAAAS